ncbi:MAG: Multiple RNA-binding domain-containing protein 1 [Cirrosporium novae-zelandiae]|nr:MAG: Multiple RNA-binding domain-containing protein 1 [Cirrosporium novae-zelandiae]
MAPPEPEPSSRVFVSGLAPTCTDAILRKHFATRFDITDSKVVSGRRIGFVGLKSPELAQQAAKYFNKSFLGLARLRVEIARPIVSDSDRRGKTGQGNNGLAKSFNAESNDEQPQSSTTPTGVKRKHDAFTEKEQDPKLKEYLNVMMPGKSRLWANEDGIMDASPNLENTKIGTQLKESPDDEEYEEIPKKRRKEKKEREDKHIKEVVDELEPMIIQKLDQEEVNENDNVEVVQAEADQPQHAEPAPPVSDSDWLRSKTSRLLGLVDDDELDIARGVPQEGSKEPEKAGGVKRASSPSLSEASTSDAGTQTGSEDKDETLANPDVGAITQTGRLFLRNLAYSVEEEDIENYFSPFGRLEEVHVPKDLTKGQNKGIAFVQFGEPSAAVEAYQSLDGKDFEGRLLHIRPAAAKRENGLDEFALSKLPLKKQKEIERKKGATTSTFNWNHMYMNPDAVTSAVADRYGISKSELLDPTSSDAAVRQAHAETSVIQETKKYFVANGVDLDAFNEKRKRGDTVILVKNFSYETKAHELKKLFEEHGSVTRFLMPPHGTIAIVEFAEANQAHTAFKSLAYRRIENSILFLEKAPKDLFKTKADVPMSESVARAKTSALDLKVQPEEAADTTTLHVKNLNFSTTTERLKTEFKALDGFVSAKVNTKPNSKRPGETLSMGYGFLEFKTKEQAQAALAAMNGHKLDGHELLIKPSQKVSDAAEGRRKEDTAKKVAARRTKVIIKNLPFEASKKDIRSLLSSYGQLKSVRVPKKFDNSARGFAFAEFISPREAENAIEALKDTHLLGRRLVFQFSIGDEIDPEEEIEKMQKKVGRQVDRVALQKLTGGGRKKFTVDGQDDDE